MLKEELKQFYGSERFYKFHQGTLLIEGVKYFAEKADAFWLISDITINCKLRKELKNEDFIVVKVFPPEFTEGVIVKYEDGNDNELLEEYYQYALLPDNESYKFWFTNNVLLLPSEY